MVSSTRACALRLIKVGLDSNEFARFGASKDTGIAGIETRDSATNERFTRFIIHVA
jgi:hypothetical protein